MAQPPGPGEDATLPKWMSAIDSFTCPKALGLGFLLVGREPEEPAHVHRGRDHRRRFALATGEQAVAIAVYTVLAACTVMVPVVGYLVASERLRGPLEELRVWLQQSNAAVMSVLLLVLGVVLVGKGLGGL